MVTYRRGGSGRQALFCQGVCRADYKRTREALIAELDKVGPAVSNPSHEDRQYRAQLRWSLSHYPQLDS